MPECRKQLVAEASDAVPSRNILLGENGHIVADKSGGPRGESILSSEDRDRYPNLILLCQEHHKTIDDDPAAWPAEKLHVIKADHEMWVATALDGEADADTEIYRDLVTHVAVGFLLDGWSTFCDNAFRGILDGEFVDAVYGFGIKVFRTHWPESHPELRRAIENLDARARKYVDHFLTHSYMADHHNCFRQDKFYKRPWPNPRYRDELVEFRRYEMKCTRLLFNLVRALNEFAEAVRATIDPEFYRKEGKFMMEDAQGLMGPDYKPTVYFPEDYFPDETLERLDEDDELRTGGCD